MYNENLDQYEYGHNFKRDGSDYNPSYQMPFDFRDIYKDLRDKKLREFVVIVTGRIYKGRSKISGVGKKVEWSTMVHEVRRWGIAPSQGFYKPMNNEEFAQRLLDLEETPIHITAVYIQPLD